MTKTNMTHPCRPGQERREISAEVYGEGHHTQHAAAQPHFSAAVGEDLSDGFEGAGRPYTVLIFPFTPLGKNPPELVPEDALMEWSNRGREGKPKRILDQRYEKK